MSLCVDIIPEKCEHCGRGAEVVSLNITHNLNEMAKEADIYGVIWHPKDNLIVEARQLIKPLQKAIDLLKEDPVRFKKFNATNGWGLYEHLVKFLENYFHACIEHPGASIRISR